MRRLWPGRRRLAPGPAGVAALVTIVALTTACADPVEPEPLEPFDPPVLRTLSVTDAFFARDGLGGTPAYESADTRYGGLLSISAVPVDTSFRLLGEQRVPVELTVSSGDRETAGLYRRHCTPGGYGNPCFEFAVIMQDGHRAAEIADRVLEIGGRFHMLSGGIAGVTMFYPDVENVARQVALWPGVSHTAYMSGGCGIPEGCDWFTYSELLVPMPVDIGSPVPDDGIVQVQLGDVLTVTYQQPDGGTIEATARVP